MGSVLFFYLVGSRMVLGTLRVMTNRLLEWIDLKKIICVN